MLRFLKAEAADCAARMLSMLIRLHALLFVFVASRSGAPVSPKLRNVQHSVSDHQMMTAVLTFAVSTSTVGLSRCGSLERFPLAVFLFVCCG